MNKQKYLVTGVAGFIGSFVAKKLCREGHIVVGIDNLNDYYDPDLKKARLEQLKSFDLFTFIKLDISDREGVASLFENECFDKVIHLAAQAGVRYSIENPMAYIDSNIVGFTTILEGCRNNKIKHLIYASSSSVYGANTKVPFSESDNVDHPVSLYAATKKSNELMAHTYSHLYNIPTTGLRFFTVYGPWGRPDMSPFLFTDAILNKRSINVFNNGEMSRDFTYIDDVVESIYRIQDVIPSEENNEVQKGSPLYKIYNVGNNKPSKLEDFISSIERSLGDVAIKNYLPMQDGDVVRTYADSNNLEKTIDFKPNTKLQDGIDNFVEWYIMFYGENLN